MRATKKTCALTLGAMLAWSGCGSPAEPVDASVIEHEPVARTGVTRLPSDGPFAPSQARFVDGGAPRGMDVSDVERCNPCHADAVAQWRTSAHAWSSFNNPIYRVSVDGFREAQGVVASRHCGGCHDISLFVDGAMDAPIEAEDPRAVGGVTCATCHRIEETRSDGNGSWSLRGVRLPLPRPNDDESLRAHLAAARPQPLATAQLCGSCHRAFLGVATGNGHHVAGADDLTPWQRSAYAGSLAERLDDEVEPATCQGCHMPQEDAVLGDRAATNGRIASHRFLGAHTWLARMRGDDAQLARLRAFLEDAVSLDVPVVVHEDGERALIAEGAPLRAGERLVLDVVLRNRRVGHRFPGGTLDAQDAWVELVVEQWAPGARVGRRIAESGTEHAASGSDPSAYLLRAFFAGEDGQARLEREVHEFRAIVWNHSLTPRDVGVVEYALAVPRALPDGTRLRVVATLRHRSRNLALQRAACAEVRTERGAAFQRAAASNAGMMALDPCAEQPIVEIARSEVWLGGRGPVRGSEAPSWRRLYEHGLGFLHAVQERTEEAKPSLERAMELVDHQGAARERAMVRVALAQLAARQGRAEDAEVLLDEAERLMPGHPAIDRARGDALAQVWRWQEAIAPLRAAAEGAPLDDDCWRRYALACASAGDDRCALEATTRGLALAPRDPDMLRIQSLALGQLEGVPAAEREAAQQAFLAYRLRDDGPRVRAACSRAVDGCALDRQPVHIRTLRAVR